MGGAVSVSARGPVTRARRDLSDSQRTMPHALQGTEQQQQSSSRAPGRLDRSPASSIDTTMIIPPPKLAGCAGQREEGEEGGQSPSAGSTRVRPVSGSGSRSCRRGGPSKRHDAVRTIKHLFTSASSSPTPVAASPAVTPVHPAVAPGRGLAQAMDDLRDTLQRRARSTATGKAALTEEERRAANALCSCLCNYALSGAEAINAMLPVNLEEEEEEEQGSGRTAHTKAAAKARATPAPDMGGFSINHMVVVSAVNAGTEEAATASSSSTALVMSDAQYQHTMEDLGAVAGDARMAVLRVGRYAKSVIELIKTWEHMSTHHLDALARDTFAILHKAHPTYVTLFSARDPHGAALAVMRRIGLGVASFCQPVEMLAIMSEVGARLRLYGLQEEHLLAVRDAFMKAYPKYAPKDDYVASPEVWEAFWRITINLLITGSRSDAGTRYDAQRHAAWSQRLQEVFAVIAARQQGAISDARRHPFFHAMFIRAILADPAIEAHAAYQAPRACDRAMESLIKAVKVFDNADEAAAVITEEVNTHTTALALSPEVLAQFKQPFLDTCEQYIGKDPQWWSPITVAVLEGFWDFVVQTSTKAHADTRAADPAVAHAPDGSAHFCLMFTDIEASTRLWERDNAVMAEAVKYHHAIIRGLINDYGGYEVKTVGDSFMIACKTPLIALQIALGTQLELMKYSSATGFRMVPNTQGGGDPACWREDSVRVRIGIHYCTNASAVYDSVSKRYDYYGPSVNCAARVEAAACGGQILMTKECVDELWKCTEFTEQPRPRGLCGYTEAHRKANGGTTKPLSEYVDFSDMGWRDMKGIAEPVHLISALPVTLSGRTFETNSRYANQSTRTDASAFMHMPIDSVANEVFGAPRYGP